MLKEGIVLGQDIQIDQAKIEVIAKFPNLISIKDVWFF